MPIRQITIIGTGLIGGSFALALRKRRFLGRIVGCDRESALKRAGVGEAKIRTMLVENPRRYFQN